MLNIVFLIAGLIGVLYSGVCFLVELEQGLTPAPFFYLATSLLLILGAFTI